MDIFEIRRGGRQAASTDRFVLGALYATKNAVKELDRCDVLQAIEDHARGDWGLVDKEDWQSNEEALTEGLRLFSVYESMAGLRFWVITEADRSATTVLLPADY